MKTTTGPENLLLDVLMLRKLDLLNPHTYLARIKTLCLSNGQLTEILKTFTQAFGHLNKMLLLNA